MGTTRHRILPPEWETNRPFLTGSVLRDTAVPRGSLSGGPTLAPLPPQTQESLAVEDVLFALLGINTQFLEHYVNEEGLLLFNADTVRTRNSDVQISPLIAKVLPLANDYIFVREFVEETRIAVNADGFVRQSVGVAISEMLRMYREFIVKVEEEHRKNGITLQRLVFLLQPTMRSMSLLRKIVESVAGKRGGAALDAVYRLASSFVGSEDREDILMFIVQRVAEPVLAMVDSWVLKGTIDDPSNEFFVREDTAYATNRSAVDVQDSRFWANRYAINVDNLPNFLNIFVEKILRAGKYLNVLRDCGLEIPPIVAELMEEERANHRGSALYNLMQPDGADGLTHMKLTGKELLSPDAARRIGVRVNLYFTVASRALMQHLRREVKLVARLHSIRRYFFMEQGDFLVHFFDAAHIELLKEHGRVSRTRLASLLELSVRTSVTAADPYHENLTCRLHPDDIATQVAIITGGAALYKKTRARGVDSFDDKKKLVGYDAFSFDYKLEWPMKLIVSEIEMLKYQLISRYLLHCKRVEYELEHCWFHHKLIRGKMHVLRAKFARSFALRNRMLQFVRSMLYYTLADVLEPNWSRLEKDIARADTLDSIIEQHSSFLDTSLRESLVSNDKHLKVLYSITQVCILFSFYTRKYCSELTSHNTEQILALMEHDKFQVTVAKFETRFDTNLRTLMDGLTAMSKKRASSHLANLCECLDVSRFYENSTRVAAAAYI